MAAKGVAPLAQAGGRGAQGPRRGASRLPPLAPVAARGVLADRTDSRLPPNPPGVGRGRRGPPRASSHLTTLARRHPDTRRQHGARAAGQKGGRFRLLAGDAPPAWGRRLQTDWRRGQLRRRRSFVRVRTPLGTLLATALKTARLHRLHHGLCWLWLRWLFDKLWLGLWHGLWLWHWPGRLLKNVLLGAPRRQWQWLRLPAPQDTRVRQGLRQTGGVGSDGSPAEAARPEANYRPEIAALVSKAARLGRAETGLFTQQAQQIFEPREGGSFNCGAKSGKRRLLAAGRRRRNGSPSRPLSVLGPQLLPARHRCSALAAATCDRAIGSLGQLRVLLAGVVALVGREPEVSAMLEDVLFLVLGVGLRRCRFRAAAALHVQAVFLRRQLEGGFVVLRRDFEGRQSWAGRRERGHGFLTFSRCLLGNRSPHPPSLSKPQRPHPPQLDTPAGVNASGRQAGLLPERRAAVFNSGAACRADLREVGSPRSAVGAASRAKHKLELGAGIAKLRSVKLVSGVRGYCGGNPAGARCPSEGGETPGGAAAGAAGPAAADKNREM